MSTPRQKLRNTPNTGSDVRANLLVDENAFTKSGALLTRPRYWNRNPMCGITVKSKPAPYVNRPFVSFRVVATTFEVVQAVPQIVCRAVAPCGTVTSTPPPASANGRTFSICSETTH